MITLATGAAKFWPSFQWRYLLLLPVAAGIVHLIATFMAMSDTRNSAYRRLSLSLPINVMKVLPAVEPGQQPLPFLSADARYAMCRFSSRQGPIAVQTILPGPGWTIGIYHQDGTTAYFAAGSTARQTLIAATVLPADQRFLGLTPQALGKSENAAPQLAITAKEGLIVVRAPDRGASNHQGDEAVLAKATCTAQSF
jgi:uncharacterized membrane protein